MKIIFFRSQVNPPLPPTKKKNTHTHTHTPYEKEKVSLKHPWPYDPKHTL